MEAGRWVRRLLQVCSEKILDGNVMEEMVRVVRFHYGRKLTLLNYGMPSTVRCILRS